MRPEPVIFDAGRIRLEKGINLVEASAGTGKTYAIAMLALRAIAELGTTVETILIVTFTKAATEELRARIRARLAEARDLLEGRPVQPDDTLASWAQTLADREVVLARLRLALYDIDRMGVFTIHSFCRRMLQEQALESGQLFDVELLADIDDIRRQVADDFWRRHVYSMAKLPCALVTAQYRTPTDLLTSIKGVGAAVAVEPEPGDLQTILVQIEAAFSGLAGWWNEHTSGLQAVMEQAVAEQKMKKDFREGFAVWWQDCDAFFRQEKSEPPAHLDWLTNDGLLGALNGQRLRGNKKQEFLAGLDLPEAEMERFRQAAKGLQLGLRSRLAQGLIAEVERRLGRNGAMSFDDLIRHLDRALQAESGLQEQIGRRYKVALIDEFQDTDAMQWSIFRSLFGGGKHYFYLIGDPKQAIYKFRGADIFSYFQAKKVAWHHLSLERNHRSHPDLVEEVNRLFTGRPEPFAFPEEIMDYRRVAPARDAGEGHLTRGDSKAAAMLYCHLPAAEGGAWSSGKAAEKIRSFVVAEVIRLVDCENPMLIAAGERSRPVLPQDIAVLVRSNAQAQGYLQAFADARVPAVVASRVSVFQTEACQELLLLLEAIAAPGDSQRLKTAMTIPWFGMTGDRLQDIWQDESSFDGWHHRFQLYFRLWQEKGVLAMMVRLIRDEDVLVHLAKHSLAKRHIANIRHLLELIQTAASTDNLGINKSLRWIREKMRDDRVGEEVELRLESDEAAVKIVTMHSAKGLEYPIVFCPYLWYRSIPPSTGSKAVLCHDVDQRLVLDLGSDRFEERQEQAAAESFAEDLRIAYVALTRARLCCYVFWAEVKSSPHTTGSFDSALGYLLFPEGPCDDTGQRKTLLARSASAGVGTVELSETNASEGRARREDREMILTSCPPAGRSLHTDWQTTSYSALASLSDRDEQERTAVAVAGALPDPIVCPGLPAGPGFGNVVHALLEQVPFADLAGTVEIDALLSRQCRRYGVRAEFDTLKRLLSTVVTTPLGTGVDSAFSLAELAVDRCIREMPFFFHPERIATDEINAILAAEPTVVPLARRTMQGFVTGFVDLFFVHRGRFYIIDYKTNYLGEQAVDYALDKLTYAMADHNYGLQYWIYTLVLDRYLRNMLPDYNYERHFGGVFYLFVRGMRPSVAGSGVYFARPDRKILDRLAAAMGAGS